MFKTKLARWTISALIATALFTLFAIIIVDGELFLKVLAWLLAIGTFTILTGLIYSLLFEKW